MVGKVNKKQDSLLRIIDANFNRSKEGLRVCEDLCRYAWDDAKLTRGFKDVRHSLTEALQNLNILKLVTARCIEGDVGQSTSDSESKRADLDIVFWANSQRVKESLRVLEEVVKLINPQTADLIKNLRYKVYALEQKAVQRS